jgi:hypothetical protein
MRLSILSTRATERNAKSAGPAFHSEATVELRPVTAPSIVTASHLSKRYGQGDAQVEALSDVSLEIELGRMTAIMGPSGSGKSTLMHILAGLDQPSEGSVSIAGLEISSMNDSQLTKLRREQIGFVFQFFNLLPMLTAEENVLLPLQIAGVKPDRAWVGRSPCRSQPVADARLRDTHARGRLRPRDAGVDERQGALTSLGVAASLRGSGGDGHARPDHIAQCRCWFEFAGCDQRAGCCCTDLQGRVVVSHGR